MVLHERTLILDPDVFSGLTKEMLTELEKMGARSALVVLTGHMVRALKERRALRGRERRRGRGRGGRRGGGAGGPSGSGPFTTVPLEARKLGGAAADVAGGSQETGAGQGVPMSIETKTATPIPAPSSAGPPREASPILVVDDSEEEKPAAKRRKVDGTLEDVVIM